MCQWTGPDTASAGSGSPSADGKREYKVSGIYYVTTYTKTRILQTRAAGIPRA